MAELSSLSSVTTIELTLFLSLLLLISPIQSEPTTSSPLQLPSSTPQTISIVDFGAKGNGLDYDTKAIQSAIDACPSPHPCHVLFPPSSGPYLTGTIQLRSGVVLVVEKGAVILGGTKLEDYPKERERWYVVLAEQGVNVGIKGGGEINGQGLEFVKRYDQRKNVMVSWNQTGECLGDECRPRLVGFIGCKNVSVSDIKLVEPAYWCLHIVECDNTSIHDISIYGNFNSPNNDGIDITDSNNTIITRCHIDTGDDAICPKTSNGPLYNLTATDCWIRTKSSAIKLGSASSFDFVHLYFDNITVYLSHRGLAFQIRDGGSCFKDGNTLISAVISPKDKHIFPVSQFITAFAVARKGLPNTTGNAKDITFSNINISTRYYDPSWWGRAEPIYITTCPRDSYTKEGSISNIQFINITSISENGVFLSGSKGGLIKNLKFNNVDLSYKRWTNYSAGLVDYRPGCSGLVNHGMAGIIMEYVDGLEVENLKMKWSRDGSIGWDNPLDFRPSSVNNISLINFHSSFISGEELNYM